MADWAERVMVRLRELDKSQADLARHLRITKQAVSLWKTRATKSPEAHHLVLSAEFLETTERWILYGRDPRCYPNGKIKRPEDVVTERRRLSMGVRDRRQVSRRKQST